MNMILQPFVASDFRPFAQLAPAGFAVLVRIRNGRPMHIENRYDAEWQSHYAKQSYYLRDPLIAWGLGNTGYISWDDPQIVDPAGVVEDAKAHGLNYGVTIATGCDEVRSFAGLARRDRPFAPAECRDAVKALERLHNDSTATLKLTEAQLEALRLVAAGERYTRAAALLDISESALKARLKSARQVLGARTVAEAVHAAKARGLL